MTNHPNNQRFLKRFQQNQNATRHLNGRLVLQNHDINLIYPQFHQWLEELILQNNEFWYGWTHRRFLGKNSNSSIYPQNIHKASNIT